MCMLIYHPASAARFTRAEFADFHRRNPDGFGAIWRTPEGKIKSCKGLATQDKAWKLYRGLLSAGCETMALHWRYATSSLVDDANCHPFTAAGQTLVMHNGVLSHRSTRTHSDTRCFIADILDPLLKEHGARVIHHERFVTALDKGIGSGNKLILWNKTDPEPVIVGERKGLWHAGRWYSNTYAWAYAERRRAA